MSLPGEMLLNGNCIKNHDSANVSLTRLELVHISATQTEEFILYIVHVIQDIAGFLFGWMNEMTKLKLPLCVFSVAPDHTGQTAPLPLTLYYYIYLNNCWQIFHFKKNYAEKSSS